MQKHKLIDHLSRLNRREMTRFWEFVHSPFHNKHEGIRQLVDYLNELYPTFSPKKLNKQKLLHYFKNVSDFDEQKLALLFTYTFRLFDEFINQKILNEENNFLNNILHLKNLRNHGIAHLFEKKLRKISKKPKVQGSQYHQNNYLLKSEINEYYSQFPSPENHKYLIEKQQQLDLFFMTEKLKDACEMFLRHQILKVPFELNFIENILQEYENNQHSYEKVPTISIYYHIYKLLTIKELNQYQKVLFQLNLHEQFLPKPELENIYNYLQNFCIQKINQGNQHFLTELFKIYQSQLTKELLFQNGYLPEFHYKNIVTTGLREKAHDWVYEFIKNYKQKLNPITAENAYSYNLANYYYSTKQYLKVLELLIQVEYTDVRYSLDAKTLLLRTYFELEEEEALLSLSDAFRQYLKRNRQISDANKKGYLNLLKFTKKVFQLKMNADYWSKEKITREYQKMEKEIDSCDLIFNQRWLLDKFSEITI